MAEFKKNTGLTTWEDGSGEEMTAKKRSSLSELTRASHSWRIGKSFPAPRSVSDVSVTESRSGSGHPRVRGEVTTESHKCLMGPA